MEDLLSLFSFILGWEERFCSLDEAAKGDRHEKAGHAQLRRWHSTKLHKPHSQLVAGLYASPFLLAPDHVQMYEGPHSC